MQKIIEQDYLPRGAVAKLIARYLVTKDPPEEALIDGPAGTGKTMGTLQLIHTLCQLYPGIRVLMMRATRVDMTESTLKTFEENVVARDHPIMSRGLRRDNRRKYVYPNGSEIILCGMDQPTRLFSTEYDLIYINEATEFNEAEYESLFRSLRNNKLPIGQCMIVDCNPDASTHWLNRRPEKQGSVMERFSSRHWENPVYFDSKGNPTEFGSKYLARLNRLGGVRRDRLFLGIWVTAEGVIWDTFDPAVNIVNPGERTKDRPFGNALPPFKYYFASKDFGYRAPGSMSLWGVTEDRRMFRLRQHYRVQKGMRWWAQRIKEWYDRWDISRVVVDPSRPDNIQLLNEELHRMRVPALVVKANNDHAGLDVVRILFQANKLMFVRNGLVKPDPILQEDSLPLCTEDEIPAYVWAEIKDGQPIKEDPEKDAVDHGCDELRYACMYLYRHLVPKARRKGTNNLYSKGTLGDLLGHNEVDWNKRG